MCVLGSKHNKLAFFSVLKIKKCNSRIKRISLLSAALWMMREPTSDSRNWTDRWVIIKLHHR